MSNDIKVDPTPIQRNALDVAMELTELSLKVKRPESHEELKTIFAEYYALAKVLNSVNFMELEKYLSDDMKELLKAYK